MGDVLNDGGGGSAVLGGDLGDGGMSEVSESVVSEQDLGVGLGLPLAVVSVDGGDNVGHNILADGLLKAGHVLADNNVSGGACGRNGGALLANHNGLECCSTDWDNNVGHNKGSGVAKVSETVMSAQQELGVGLSLGGGGGEGGRGQEGKLEGDLGRVKNCLWDPFTELK